MKRNYMLDIETLSYASNAAITSIGVVAFDFESKVITDAFYEVVDLQSSVAAGGVIDADTVMWWMKQSDEARAEFAKPSSHLAAVLHDLTLWMDLHGLAKSDRCIWGNATTFDNVILANAYSSVGMDKPWSYSSDRCYRTIKNLAPHIKLERVGTHHNALDDAKSQALHLINLYEELGLKAE